LLQVTGPTRRAAVPDVEPSWRRSYPRLGIRAHRPARSRKVTHATCDADLARALRHPNDTRVA